VSSKSSGVPREKFQMVPQTVQKELHMPTILFLDTDFAADSISD
jgi:hypothetical protein